MGNFFGARPHEPALYDNGCLNFEKVREFLNFQKGMENVLLGLRLKHRIALMCTEKHPFDCHRSILIARAFAMKNIPAKHILFAEDFEMDESYYLNEAYKLRNKEIGHHI